VPAFENLLYLFIYKGSGPGRDRNSGHPLIARIKPCPGREGDGLGTPRPVQVNMTVGILPREKAIVIGALITPNRTAELRIPAHPASRKWNRSAPDPRSEERIDAL